MVKTFKQLNSMADNIMTSYVPSHKYAYGPPKMGSSKKRLILGKIKNSLKRAYKKKLGSTIKTGFVYNEGTGGQCSYFNGPVGKKYLPAHVENALAPVNVVKVSAVQIKSAVGQQAVGNMDGVMLPALATNYTTDKITRVLYEKATQDITINNIYLSNCYIILYDIMCRKDVSGSTLAVPNGAWQQGDQDLGVSNAYTILGSTPWQSEAFNQYYKVMQTTQIVLGAGGTHVHKVRVTPNKVISSAYATYTPYGFKDCSYFCMIEFHGSPANDTVTQTQVTVGGAGLNIVIDHEETIKLLEAATPVLNVTNSLLSSFTVAEQVVNLGGSTIVPNAEG